MSDDLGTLLKSAAAEPTSEFDVDDLRARGTRIARRRLVAFVSGISALVLLVGVGVVAAAQGLGATGSVEVVGQPHELSEATWQQMPSSPVDGRVFPSVVWTGDRLLVWGGEKPSEEQWHDTGAAFDPDTMTWTEIAEAPISPRSEHVALWTGDRMIVCCGRVRGEPGAAAYNPATDTWRKLPTSPVGRFDVGFAVAVWTGNEMIVTGGITGGGTGTVRTTAAYDPETDRWRTLPDVPVALERRAAAVWTGEQMIVWPTDGKGGWALDPQAERWTELPDAPDGARPVSASAVWTGHEVVIVGARPSSGGPGSEEKLVAAAYRPSTGSWRTLDPGLPEAVAGSGNVGSQAAVWTGDRVLVWTGSLGSGTDQRGTVVLAYNPDRNTWEQLPLAPRAMWRPELAWTGSELVAIGQEASLILTSRPPTDGSDPTDTAPQAVQQVLAYRPPASYVMDVHMDCFCPEDWLRITIIDGVKVEVARIEGPGQLATGGPPVDADFAPTIKNIQQQLRDTIARGGTVREIAATENGRPLVVDLDPVPNAVDDEIRYEITHFETSP